MRSRTSTAILAVLLLCVLTAPGWPVHRLALAAPPANGGKTGVVPNGSQLPWNASRERWRNVSTPYVVLFVLDGARPDYFNVPGIPHIRTLMQNGTQYSNALSGILESETPSGHATIGTGSTPRADGILSFDWATDKGTKVNLFDPTIIRAGVMENIMRQAHVPTIAGLVHTRDRQALVAAIGGHKYYAQDAIGGPDADIIMYYRGIASGQYQPTFIPGHAPPASVLAPPYLTAPSFKHLPLGEEDHLTMQLAIQTFKTVHPRVMMINLAQFDWPLGHVDGATRDPKGVITLMQGFDRDLAALEDTLRRANVLDRTVFIMTADHGMTPVYHTVPKSIFTDAVVQAKTSILSQAYSTGSYLWLQDKSRSATVAANIVAAHNPYIQSVYYKVFGPHGTSYVRAPASPALRVPQVDAANQYLLQSFNGPNGPDVVTLFTEHAASQPGGAASWKGNHGGAAWRSQHIPLILSGYGVRQHYMAHYPAPLIDVAPTLLWLMGIPSTGMQGTALVDAIKWHAPAWAQQAQTRQGKLLWPLVNAMKAESNAEVRK